MDREEVTRRKADIVQKHGPWTAHNIHLIDDIYTIDEKIVHDQVKLRRFIQNASDLIRRPFEELRVLDLACLEGLFGIEFARQGAEVVSIEGRASNIAKANFSREVLGLDNLTIHQDDVRNLSKEKYGEFDVVICSGILYHLDTPDVSDFVARISEVCRHLAIVDTLIALQPKLSLTYRSKIYWGMRYQEHRQRASEADKVKRAWASLDNPSSFMFTRPSLYNLLRDVGFTSVLESMNPAVAEQWQDRLTLIALKGEERSLASCPRLNSHELSGWPEERSRKTLPVQKWQGRLVAWLRFHTPAPVRKAVRRILPS